MMKSVRHVVLPSAAMFSALLLHGCHNDDKAKVTDNPGGEKGKIRYTYPGLEGENHEKHPKTEVAKDPNGRHVQTDGRWMKDEDGNDHWIPHDTNRQMVQHEDGTFHWVSTHEEHDAEYSPMPHELEELLYVYSPQDHTFTKIRIEQFESIFRPVWRFLGKDGQERALPLTAEQYNWWKTKSEDERHALISDGYEFNMVKETGVFDVVFLHPSKSTSEPKNVKDKLRLETWQYDYMKEVEQFVGKNIDNNKHLQELLDNAAHTRAHATSTPGRDTTVTSGHVVVAAVDAHGDGDFYGLLKRYCTNIYHLMWLIKQREGQHEIPVPFEHVNNDLFAKESDVVVAEVKSGELSLPPFLNLEHLQYLSNVHDWKYYLQDFAAHHSFFGTWPGYENVVHLQQAAFPDTTTFSGHIPVEMAGSGVSHSATVFQAQHLTPGVPTEIYASHVSLPQQLPAQPVPTHQSVAYGVGLGDIVAKIFQNAALHGQGEPEPEPSQAVPIQVVASEEQPSQEQPTQVTSMLDLISHHPQASMPVLVEQINPNAQEVPQVVEAAPVSVHTRREVAFTSDGGPAVLMQVGTHETAQKDEIEADESWPYSISPDEVMKMLDGAPNHFLYPAQIPKMPDA